MTPKTMHEQLEEIEKGCHKYTIGKPYFDEDGDKVQDNFSCNEYRLCPECEARKSQLQTDMKIVKELKEKIEKEFRFTDLQCERLDKLFKESVGR
jgi:hypothetical protein